MGQYFAGIFLFLLLLGCGATWVTLIGTALRGQPMLPWVPRLRPRWDGWEALAVFVAFHWTLLPGALVSLYKLGTGEIAREVRITSSDMEPATQPSEELAVHPVLLLLLESRDPLTIVSCFILVALVGPIAEELIFRLVLTGYLLRKEKLWRVRTKALRSIPRGALSVAVISGWFALLHARSVPESVDIEGIWEALLSTATLGMLCSLLVLALAARKPGSLAENLGISRQHFVADIGYGTVAFLAVTPPLWIVQSYLLPVFARWGIAPDPIPIVALGLALGALFASTGRIIPSIVLHIHHNFWSLVIALLPQL